jgi:transcriptional regulatory protein LevR
MKMKDWLSSAINTDITDDELGFLAIFLRQGQEKMKNPGVWITLVSCNEHTASSIGNFINAILTPCHIHWVDGKPVNSMHNIFEILCDSIKMFHGAGGNLIFTDIDVLTGLEYELYRATGVKCRVIPSLDHHLIVEACKTTMASDCALDGICRSIIENHCESMLRFYSSYGIDMPAVFKKPRQTSPAKVILTICVTGVGSAQRIKEILERKLYYIPNLTIVAMSSLDDTAGAAAAYGPSLKLIVGTINPGILNTPFLSSGSVFTTNGLYYISTILNDWNCNFYNIDSNFADYKGDELNHILNDAFSFIAPNVEAKNAVPGIFRMIDALEEIVYSGRLPDDIKARIFMHAASMLERIISGNVLEMDDDAEKLIARKKNWFTLLEDVIQNAFKPYGYGIPREENYYFMLSLPETGDLQSK